jgi:hypothetical protein
VGELDFQPRRPVIERVDGRSRHGIKLRIQESI